MIIKDLNLYIPFIFFLFEKGHNSIFKDYTYNY